MRPTIHTHSSIPQKPRAILAIFLIASCIAVLLAVDSNSAMASTVYGDINNFDAFNDAGVPCYGFEIELDDIRSTDITYTFDWNHYGPPKITEDLSNPAHPKVFIRYSGKYNAATNTFSAYTAVPPAPPSPTNGHQCTNPSVNIGCEHFGVGHYGAPTTIRYNWLIEDPLSPGTLKLGPAVNVTTPSWIYYPPAPAQPVAQVQAIIIAPPPPPAPVYEFGDAVWMKSIVTTSHNNQVVELKDLISDDPDDPNDKNWANGEPDEVEIEWHILQTEFNNPAGANNELAGNPEDLVNGDEVITRRYEFYKYAGPLDTETNEAQCDNYPQISDPADPKYKDICAPPVEVLGDYIGAQMAGFNVEAVLGLVDHLQDGELNQPYTTRTVVVGGNTPYVTSVTEGPLPDGLNLDSGTGVLSGVPSVVGNFPFRITATDADNVQVTKTYTVSVIDTADGCPDDPAKTEPGVCGCGVPDTDGDADGTPDCNDQCPADPNKTETGICGCGVADIDSDTDGSYACIDDCNDTDADINPAATEVCDGKDNDCDDQIDEGLTRQTTCGVGACSGNTGTESCIAGVWGSNTCNPHAGATAELCDGLIDNNCDGTVDEGCNCTNGATHSCGIDTGECVAGTETCVNGVWNGVCAGAVDPEAEVCDSKDNNCDGTVDEGFDADSDGIADCSDTCPNDPDSDVDGDGVCGDTDNCPERFNLNQTDSDNDGIGDACDPEIINPLVSFIPVGKKRVSTDTTGCPDGFAGTYYFDAELKNVSSSSLTDQTIMVATLSNGNLLQNADGGPGGLGAELTVPLVDSYADGVLSPGESAKVPFRICMKQWKAFSFFVDVWGIIQ